MTRPRVLAAIAAWLVVVAGVSTLVWFVISRAGGQLVAPQQPLVATSEQAGQPRAPAGPSAQPSDQPSDPPSAQPPTGERRTWQGSAGLVIAVCDPGGVRLVSAQPIDGFHAEVKEAGPEELEVEFEGREDESDGDVTVVARCSAGVPGFTVEAEDD
jgi:hypothetical protein